MDKKCAIYGLLSFVGKKWTLLILLELYKHKTSWRRYFELKNSFEDITPKILSLRLKGLVKEGMVEKRVDSSTFPLKSEYSLSESGLEFIDAIKCMKDWAVKWKGASAVCKSKDCRECLL